MRKSPQPNDNNVKLPMQSSNNNTSGLIFGKANWSVSGYLLAKTYIFILNTPVLKVRILYIHNYPHIQSLTHTHIIYIYKIAYALITNILQEIIML